ncbi:MAG: ATP-binding cassette domain-containing protein, partial [Pseudomonadota bacterium]
MLFHAFPSVFDTLRGSVRPLLWLSFVMNALLLTGPLYMLLVYDRVLSSQSAPTLIALTALMAVCYGVYGYLDSARARILTRLSLLFEERAGGAAFSASLQPEQSSGALDDMTTLKKFIASPVMGALFDAPWAPLFVAALFLLHWTMGLLAIAALAILTLAKIVHDRMAMARRRADQGAAAALSTPMVAEMMRRDAATLQETGAGDRILRKWRADGAEAAMREAAASDGAAQFSSATKALRLFLQSAMLGLGAMLVLMGELSAGAMIAGSILMGRGLAPIEQLIAQYRLLLDARTADQRFTSAAGAAMQPLTSAAPALAPRAPRPSISGPSPLLRRLTHRLAGGASDQPASTSTSLIPWRRAAAPAADAEAWIDRASFSFEAKGVFFVPQGGRKPILSKVSFELAPGQSLGVYGEAASGKSLLGRMAIGGLRPSLGAVFFGGREIAEIAPALMGDRIGYLSQSPSFLPGNIAETISRHHHDQRQGDVIGAAELVGLHEVIEALPGGYQCDIREAEATLSAGQRHRLAMARAVFEFPDLIVFDEPGATLSDDGVRRFNTEVLPRLRDAGSIVIVLTHSQRMLQAVDKILLLDKGEQRAFGAREAILARLRKASGETDALEAE